MDPKRTTFLSNTCKKYVFAGGRIICVYFFVFTAYFPFKGLVKFGNPKTSALASVIARILCPSLSETWEVTNWPPPYLNAQGTC